MPNSVTYVKDMLVLMKARLQREMDVGCQAMLNLKNHGTVPLSGVGRQSSESWQ